VIDSDLMAFDAIWAAAGTPNAVFAVPPATLRTLANATVAPIAVESARAPSGEATVARRAPVAEARRPAGAASGA
jgi:hypothetical protein